MKRFISFSLLAICYLLFALPLIAQTGGDGADPRWGTIQRKIALQRGTHISAWDANGRADVSLEQYGTFAATMTPTGDGTFQIRFELTPGAEYNFAFFAISTQTLTGITTGVTYFDAVPNSGSDAAFITSTSPFTPQFNNTASARYISIGGDARRFLRMPYWLEGGTTFYVFNNWASTPTAPTNFRARPGNMRVDLSWGAPYGHWGTTQEQYKAIDVIAGGAYHIYRSSISAEGPYEIVASTPGHFFSWTDTSVQNGIRYYYAITSSDAYRGAIGGPLADVQLASRREDSPVRTLTPGETIPTRFRVENIDWRVIKKRDYLVWLTPENAYDKYSQEYKTQARITQVKVSKTLNDWLSSILGWLL